MNILFAALSKDEIQIANAYEGKHKIILAVPESLASEVKFTRPVCFEDGTKRESMLNCLLKREEGGFVLVNNPSLLSLADELPLECDIGLLKNPINKVKCFFKRFIQRIIKVLFGIDFYDGDNGIIFMNENPAKILRNLSTNAGIHASKVNSFVGYEINEKNLSFKETKYKLTSENKIKLSVSTVLFVTCLTLMILLNLLIGVNFWYQLLLILLLVGSMVFSVYAVGGALLRIFSGEIGGPLAKVVELKEETLKVEGQKNKLNKELKEETLKAEGQKNKLNKELKEEVLKVEGQKNKLNKELKEETLKVEGQKNKLNKELKEETLKVEGQKNKLNKELKEETLKVEGKKNKTKKGAKNEEN